MKKFEFLNNTFEADIAGTTVKGNLAEVEIFITKLHHDLVDFGEKISQGNATQNDVKTELTNACNAIDGVFGKGTAKDIFEDRIVTYNDVADIVVYLMACLNEFEQIKQKAYNEFGLSREQKRSVKAVK